MNPKITGEEYMKLVRGGGNFVDPPESLFEIEKLQTLTEQQIEKGIIRLKFKHPLKDTSIWKVVPYFGWVQSCISFCGGGSDAAKIEDSGNSVVNNPLRKQNTFYNLQKEVKRHSGGKKDNAALKALVNEMQKRDGSFN